MASDFIFFSGADDGALGTNLLFVFQGMEEENARACCRGMPPRPLPENGRARVDVLVLLAGRVLKLFCVPTIPSCTRWLVARSHALFAAGSKPAKFGRCFTPPADPSSISILPLRAAAMSPARSASICHFNSPSNRSCTSLGGRTARIRFPAAHTGSL